MVSDGYRSGINLEGAPQGASGNGLHGLPGPLIRSRAAPRSEAAFSKRRERCLKETERAPPYSLLFPSCHRDLPGSIGIDLVALFYEVLHAIGKADQPIHVIPTAEPSVDVRFRAS